MSFKQPQLNRLSNYVKPMIGKIPLLPIARHTIIPTSYSHITNFRCCLHPSIDNSGARKLMCIRKIGASNRRYA